MLFVLGFLRCVFCFVCLRLVSFVPDVASFYGLFILDCPFGFLFLVFLFAFPLKKKYNSEVSAKTGWLEMMWIMCLSGATFLPTDCCFSELAL